MMGTSFPRARCSWLISSMKSSSCSGRRYLTYLPPRSMLRDERAWDNPAEFQPERFLQGLKDGQVDPKSLIFGFGRR